MSDSIPIQTTANRQPAITIMAGRFYPEQHGGVETHLWAFANELAASGVSTEVWTENRTDAQPSETVRDGLRIIRREQMNVGRLWRLHALMRLRWWMGMLKEHQPKGCIWASDPVMAAAVILAGRGKQLVFNPAGCTAAMNDIARKQSHITSMRVGRLLRMLDRFAYRRAPQMVVSSQNVAMQYTQHHGRRGDVFIQPLGAPMHETQMSINCQRDHARSKFGLEPNAFVIGFVGRLDPCKDLDFLFHATQLLIVDQPVRILIVGDGPSETSIRESARSRGIDHMVHYAGRLEDTAPAYAAMDTMVLPSVYEAFGQVLLEAMSAGVPVIGRANNGQTVLTASNEIIADGECGYVVDSTDPQDLTNQLLRLIDDESLCQAMGTNAAALAAAHTWADYTQAIIQQLKLQSSGMTTHANDNEYRCAA